MLRRRLAVMAIALVSSGCGRIGFGVDSSSDAGLATRDAEGADAHIADAGVFDARVPPTRRDGGEAGVSDDAGADGGVVPTCLSLPGCVEFSCPSSGRCYLACSEGRIRSQAEALCYAFTDGRLSCIDERAELDCITAHVAPVIGERFWLGHEQDGSATRAGEGWTCYGAPIFDGAWGAGQPNDGPRTPGIEDFEEQIAVVDGAGPDDASSLESWGTLCEIRPL